MTILAPSVTTASGTTVVIPQLDYSQLSQAAINKYWSLVFYNNIRLFAGNNTITTAPSHGLIYYFVVGGQVRYIGQTRDKGGLRWRMTKRQQGGQIGYNFSIKRNLLQAASRNQLSIKTRSVLIFRLDRAEREEIHRYAPNGRLWNQEHNPYFQPSNFNQ